MQQLSSSIAEWDRGAWCLAALRLAARGDSDDALLRAAQSVLAAAGLTDAIARSPFTAPQLDALASGSLLKAAALATGRSPSWADHTDETLLAQGQVSGASGRLFAQFLLPHLPGFAERLATPGARMLDVGTGVGALAVGFAQTFPQLHVTGIDVLERVLRLAERTVADAGLADRIDLRHQDVSSLDEDSQYDLAWLPAPFIPEAPLRLGVRRLARALRPGGLLILGHGRYDGPELDQAVTRLQTLTYGGTPLDTAAAVHLLTDAGLSDARTAPTIPGAPAITYAFR
jgi:SAM-dependent methyltransferase